MTIDPTKPADPEHTPPADPPKTFTQEELDRIIADRVARAKSTPPADYEDLQKQAKELADLKKAQLSEAEKLQTAATDAEARAKAAEEKLAVANKRAAVFAAAQRAGAVDPDAVFALIDHSAVKVGNDGQLTGVDEAVKALLDDKKYLVGTPPTPTPGGADGGPRGKPAGTVTREQLQSMSSEQIVAARKAGELEHLFKT